MAGDQCEQSPENSYRLKLCRFGIGEGTVDFPPEMCFPLECNLAFLNGGNWANILVDLRKIVVGLRWGGFKWAVTMALASGIVPDDVTIIWLYMSQLIPALLFRKEAWQQMFELCHFIQLIWSSYVETTVIWHWLTSRDFRVACRERETRTQGDRLAVNVVAGLDWRKAVETGGEVAMSRRVG